MIIANYVSFGLTAPLVIWVLPRFLQVTVETGWKLALLSCALVVVVTWVVKFPFVARCLRRRSSWFSRSLSASFLINAVTSVVLFVWYLLPSELALYTDITRVATLPSMPLREALCYYVSPEAGTIHRSSLTGGQPVVVAALGPNDSPCRLRAVMEESPTCVALYAHLCRANKDHDTIPLGFKVCGDDLLLFPRGYSGSRGADEIVDLRQPDERHLEFALGPPNNPGLEITRLVTGLDARKQYSLRRERIRLALQTPFFRCHVTNVTILPHDCVVLQFENEIYVFDPASRSLRRVAVGQSPVVLLHR